jgi:hypothetical protein
MKSPLVRAGVAVGGSGFSPIFNALCRFALDNAQHAALSPFHSEWNDFASTSSLVFPPNDGRAYGLSISISAATSPPTPESLIEAYNITQGYQEQGVKA